MGSSMHNPLYTLKKTLLSFSLLSFDLFPV